jgi:cation diffusion facilitator CzcD-associated flavoprotein CzcO
MTFSLQPPDSSNSDPGSSRRDAPSSPSLDTVRVAIIGAGASGLVQLKQLLDAFSRADVKRRGKKLEVVCFEKSREVGGVW